MITGREPNILRAMAAAETPEKPPQEPNDVPRGDPLRLERQDHADFCNELLRRGLEFEHDDPVRRSRNRKGWPDFRIFRYPARTLFVEFKRPGNRLSIEQEKIRTYLEAAEFPYVIVYSLKDAILALHRWLAS